MDLADITNITIILASVIAVLAFVYDVAQRRADVRHATLQRWRTVLLQTVFQSNSTPMSFKEIRREYLIHAQQFSSYKLGPNELSDDELKSVLIRMVADRLIEFAGDDKYVISSGAIALSALLSKISDVMAATEGRLERGLHDFNRVDSAVKELQSEVANVCQRIEAITLLAHGMSSSLQKIDSSLAGGDQ